MPTTKIPEDILEKKARPGFKLIDTTKHEQKDPLTPADLVRSVFHSDAKALMKSFGSHGRAKRAKFLSDKKEGKVLQRSLKRNQAGNVVLEEKTVVGDGK